MSEANEELMRRAFEALAESGVDAMLPFIAEDFEMTTPANLAAEPDTYRGHDGVRRWFDTFYEAMDSVRIEPQEIEAVGDRVAVRFRMIARGRTTGIEAVQEAACLCHVEDEKATRMEFYATFDEARESARG